MTETLQEPESTEPKAAPLGHVAARGFSWLLGQTIGTKIINTGVQIVLAWLLAREDFGLIGLAYTVTSFISVLQQAGLREILIHRHATFRRWANAAFWMSATLGLGGMLLTLAAIPLATRIYAAPQLGGILAVLSVNALLASLTVVPQAKLSNALRFRTISMVGVVNAFVQAAVSCGLAWLGWGAYSIAVGAVAGYATQVVMLWSFAPQWPRRAMQFRRWRYMMGDSVAILLTVLLLTVISQGDYMALGVFHSAAITGLYYFAFNLSMQTISLFTLNLGNVLFPALTKLQGDPERQTQAFIRASRLLALVAIPACLLQAALADPLIRMIFPEKWYPAIPVTQILCIGMAFRAVGSPGGSLMQSQGRFKAMMIFYCILSTVYLAGVAAAAALGSIITVAIVESAFFCLLGPLQCYVAIIAGGGRGRDISRIYIPVFIGTVAALMPGYICAALLPAFTGQNIIRIALITFMGAFLFFLLIPKIVPNDWGEIWFRIRELFLRRKLGKAK